MEQFSQLSAFVRAADARSFTVAARELGVSPSAIGKAIGRLEHSVATRLFHRSTRSISLTPEGAMLLERCRRILAELEAATAELAQTRAAPRGRLRVSLPIINAVTMPLITGFMSAYPDIELDLDFGDEIVDVIGGGYDAVIRAGELTDSRLMSRQLGAFSLKLVASPDYIVRRGAPSQPEDLRHHDCLLHRFATSRIFEPWPLTVDGETPELALRPAAVVNTIEPLLRMAEDGLGIACLPDLLIRPQLESGALTSVLDRYISHHGLFRILWPASRHVAPKVKAFVDHMCSHFPPSAGSGRSLSAVNPSDPRRPAATYGPKIG